MKSKALLRTLFLMIAGAVALSSAQAGSYGSKKAEKDLVAVAASAENFTTLVAAVKAADLVGVLQGEGPFTIFAPTDAAFAALPAGTVETLLKPENKDRLVAILTYHVVPAKVMAKDVAAGTVDTANGKKLKISIKGGTVMVQDSKVVSTDIMASNGVIHVIDKVLIPDS